MITRADRDRYTFSIEREMPLSWVGFGLETGLLWFLGRAIFRFELHRHALPSSQNQLFYVRPLDSRRGLEWSNVISLKHLRQVNLFPQTLARPFKPPVDKNEETLLAFDWKTDFSNQTLGFLAYGLADMTVDLFKRGAKTVRAQYSVERTEFWADVGLSEKVIANFLSPSSKDYEPHETVSCLP